MRIYDWESEAELAAVLGRVQARSRILDAVDLMKRVTDMVEKYIQGGDWEDLEAGVDEARKDCFNEWNRD